MKLKTLILMSAGLMSFSGSARAQEGCPAGLICASRPETVAVGVQDAGFRAKVDKDDAGDPMIYSEASGFKFQILFYELLRLVIFEFNIIPRFELLDQRIL